jgi:hypothetical protein
MKRKTYRVVEAHKASFNYMIVALEGDEVSVGREDPEMLGWYWCKDAKGVEMWVPSTHMDIAGEKAVFNQPYNSVELDIAVGEEVQYLGEALAWVECLNKEWTYGWVPSSKLAPT